MLWGKTKNETSPLGTYTDEFTTTRLLGTARVTGEFNHNGTIYSPSLSFSHVSDTQASYVDSLLNVIPKQSFKLTELSAGIGFDTPVAVNKGSLNLTGNLAGIWASASGNGFTPTSAANIEGGRARLDLGLNYTTPTGVNIMLGTFYDGIGSNSFQTYGGNIEVQFKF